MSGSLVALLAAGDSPQPYTTSFAGTENPISESGKWLTGATDGLDWTDIETVPGKAYASAFDGASGGVKDGIAQLKRSFRSYTSNQYSQGTVFSTYGGSDPGSAHELEVLCNLTVAAHSITGYESYVNCSGAAHALVRWNGAFGDYTALAAGNISSPTVPVEGDVNRIWRNGSLLSFSQNGTLRTTATDTTYLSGNPGIGNNPVAGGSVAINGAGWKVWTGGSL